MMASVIVPDAVAAPKSGPLGLSPEEEVVLLCAQTNRDTTKQARLDRLLDGELTWVRVWDEAHAHQVHPLVAAVLCGDERAPDDLRRAARTTRLQTIGHNMALHGELLRIARALEERGIPAVPLKGTHLAQRLFGSLDARQVGDIDILVPEDRLEEARKILGDLGYRRRAEVSHGIEEHSFHGVPYERTTASRTLVVELHWGLTNPQSVSIDYEHLWRRIRQANPSGAGLSALPLEETLVFLAVHLPKHDVGVLRLLVDVDRLIRREGERLDWSYTAALARRWGAQGLLYFALRRARALLDTPVSEEMLSDIAPAYWRRMLVGALAGPRSLIRPPQHAHLRYNRFRLAYCAMLQPLGRSLATYRYYLFADYGPTRSGLLPVVRGAAERYSRGLLWTAIAFASCLTDWREPTGRLAVR
jgi:hypothetical protein